MRTALPPFAAFMAYVVMMVALFNAGLIDDVPHPWTSVMAWTCVTFYFARICSVAWSETATSKKSTPHNWFFRALVMPVSYGWLIADDPADKHCNECDGDMPPPGWMIAPQGWREAGECAQINCRVCGKTRPDNGNRCSSCGDDPDGYIQGAR